MCLKGEKMVTCNLLHIAQPVSSDALSSIMHGANKLSKDTKTVLSYFRVNTLCQNMHSALVLTL